MTQTPRRRRWPRVLAGIMSCLVLLATGAAAAANQVFNGITSNITAGDDKNFTSTTGGPTPGDPINILLMGSDTRTGKNGKGYGHVSEIAGARSDTTILLHISGDRTRAFAVSIPRDTKMMLPTCTAKDGTQKGGYISRFNEAFDNGGPGCTVRTVERMSGLKVDHYVVVDFTGFKEVVNALNGVEICLKKDVYDQDARLDLKAGKQVVKGEDALAFVRARKAVGDGSDLSRIERQQEFLSSAIRKATSLGVVTNPAMLINVLNAGTKSLTTDPALANADALRELAVEVSGIQPSEITFATVPWKYNDDFATVSIIPSQAEELWNAIRYDREWPPPPTNGTDGEPLTASPDSITINYENVSGVNGAALKASEMLSLEGYQTGKLVTGKVDGQSQILYNPKNADQVEAARTLSYATGLPMVEAAQLKGKAITLQVGEGFPTSVQPVVASQKTSDAAVTAKPRKADTSVCA